MSTEPDFKSELPSEETIEEGRKSSLIVGLLIGAAIVAAGLILFLLFGNKLAA